MPFDIFRGHGWLSHQPEAFQETVLAAGRERRFARGEVVYSVGDPLGGIYGIIEGQVAIAIAPADTGPHLAHRASPGWWFGEGCFLTREPRRIGLQCVTDSRLFHVPLDAMERLAVDDSETMRRFAQIAMLNIDLALRAIDDLLVPDPARRIAATLLRCLGDRPRGSVAISQSELGHLSNTSRKIVNRTLGLFVDHGWLRQGYGEVFIEDAIAIRRFVIAP